MVAPCQLPHSPVLSVTSAWRNSWNSPNSLSAASSSSSSSCSHSGDSLPSISSSSATSQESCSLKDFAVHDIRYCRNWKGAKSGPSRSFTSGERFRVLGSRRSVLLHRLELSPVRSSDYRKGRRQQLSFLCRCAASDETAAREQDAESSLELPLFPLPLVLFPGAILPLQIFEFRYRIMMHTLLQTDLRFGVVYTDKTSGVAGVGCVGEVIKHERLVDDRFFMICKGQERFRVTGIVRTKPYLVARVEWLEDRPSGDQEDVETLANEVETYMKDVIRLSNRVNGKPEKTAPEDLRKNLFPTPFSFWVGSTFEGAPVEQQALLELEDTAQRLKREKETLRNTLNYLSAASAVKDAFPSSE